MSREMTDEIEFTVACVNEFAQKHGMTKDLSARVMEEECVSLKDALRIVYGSILYQKLQNVETGLYREGPVYLYDIIHMSFKGQQP